MFRSDLVRRRKTPEIILWRGVSAFTSKREHPFSSRNHSSTRPRATRCVETSGSSSPRCSGVWSAGVQKGIEDAKVPSFHNVDSLRTINPHMKKGACWRQSASPCIQMEGFIDQESTLSSVKIFTVHRSRSIGVRFRSVSMFHQENSMFHREKLVVSLRISSTSPFGVPGLGSPVGKAEKR